MKNEINIGKLIDEIKRRPELWDTLNQFYADKIKQKESWSSVCTVLFDDFNSIVGEEKDEREESVQNEWQLIRNGYINFKLSNSNSKANNDILRYAGKLNFLDSCVDVAQNTNKGTYTPNNSPMNNGESNTNDTLRLTEIKTGAIQINPPMSGPQSLTCDNIVKESNGAIQIIPPIVNTQSVNGQSKSGKVTDLGHRIGTFRGYAHGVKGTVYAVDESTLYIDGFHYDGIGPDAYFWVGNTQRPSPEGIIVPYPEDYKGREPPVLKVHDGVGIILKLPDGKKLKDIKWLSVWCRRFTVNFGEVFVPSDLEPPKIRVLPEFKRFAHGLRSGNITILDAKTFYIPNLHYDGKGPDAYFFVGNGSEPSQQGVKVPNEVGSLEPLRAYEGEDLELQLPGNMQVYDIDWLAVWCVKFSHNFGHVMIPKDLDVPPSLGQTKISPPWWYNPTSSTTSNPDKRKEMSNCREMLSERLQVQWQVREDRIQIQLSSAIRIDQYIAFGVSGEPNRSAMIGGDVVIAYYYENSGKFHAEDYYISATSQCVEESGVCPDEEIGEKNDVKVIYGERRHGITTIIYEKILQTNEMSDRPILLGAKTNVIAAIGPLNNENKPSAHGVADKTMENTFLDFGSIGDYACSPMETDDDTPKKPWSRSVIKNTNVFSVRIGPSGGRRGFSAITKKPSLGIAWYINGKLIPELHVERGKTYTFMVEGGNIPSNYLQYHPFYITDNVEGAFGQKSEVEQKDQRVFGGISYDSEGNPLPNTAGHYCEWAYKTTDQTTLYDTFEQFFKTLEKRCDPGEPAYLNWTVDYETPNVLYYQCYVHSYMGWKIYVEDPITPQIKKEKNKANTNWNKWTINITLILYFSYHISIFLL